MTKKILSLALVVVMLFSFVVTAFAISEDTVQSTSIIAAKAAFLLEGATSEQADTSKVTLCYLKDGDWTITIRCDGGYYYDCTASETLGIPSDIDCEQENVVLAFFNMLVEYGLNFVYGLIY